MTTTLCKESDVSKLNIATSYPQSKNNYICNILNRHPIDDISVVTLKRTDTTRDLSQKAKRFGFQNKGDKGNV